MTNLLVIVFVGIMLYLAGRTIAESLIGVAVACSRFARVIDRTPNRILIPVCFTGPLWVVGFLALIAWLHG